MQVPPENFRAHLERDPCYRCPLFARMRPASERPSTNSLCQFALATRKGADILFTQGAREFRRANTKRDRLVETRLLAANAGQGVAHRGTGTGSTTE